MITDVYMHNHMLVHSILHSNGFGISIIKESKRSNKTSGWHFLELFFYAITITKKFQDQMETNINDRNTLYTATIFKDNEIKKKHEKLVLIMRSS